MLRFTLSSGLIFTDLKISVRCALRHVSITLLASIAFSVSRSGRVLGRQARLNTLVLCSVWPVYAIIYLKINVTFLTYFRCFPSVIRATDMKTLVSHWRLRN